MKTCSIDFRRFYRRRSTKCHNNNATRWSCKHNLRWCIAYLRPGYCMEQ